MFSISYNCKCAINIGIYKKFTVVINIGIYKKFTVVINIGIYKKFIVAHSVIQLCVPRISRS